ncbi:hypothetical protein D3C87_38590 [compost metagenome]
MRKLTKIGLLMTVFTFLALGTFAGPKSKEKKIPYTVANRYFVNNSVKDGGFVYPKITNQEEFEKLFGMAAVMGKDGRPTPIDFSKQFVIAVIDPVTRNSIELTAKSLTKKENTLTFTYSRKEEKVSNPSASFRYLLIVIVDKKYEGNVVVQDTDQQENIPFTIAKRYFVNNSVEAGEKLYPKITSQEEFEKLFGMAAVMGEDGQPTIIDFSKQYVIAIINAESGGQVEYTVQNLVRKDGIITLNYSQVGSEGSGSYRYCFILVVDNSYTGEVKIVRKN